MAELVTENWMYLVLALIAGLLVAWWIFVANRKTTISLEDRPVAGSAQRNQALIDAPPAAARVEIPPPAPMGLAGVGEAVQAAAEPVPVAPAPSAAEEGDDLTGGVGGAALSLTAPAYDVLLSLTGRRSEAAIRALPWSGDPGPVIELLSPYGPLPADAAA